MRTKVLGCAATIALATMVVGTAAPLAAPTTAQKKAHRLSTLRRTIVGNDKGELRFGPGRPRVRRSLRWPGAKTRVRPLAGFKHLSDIHVLDEESPARVEFLDACSSAFTSAYRPQEAMSTQVGNEMLQRLAKITHGPATGTRLKFAISTGDNIDNNQANEQDWFLRLLDGRRVNPNSGGKGYHGYTKEETPTAPPLAILKKAQLPFESVGTKVPWYGVLGNHDGLVQGNVVQNTIFNGIATGGQKAFVPIDTYDNCPEDESDLAGLADAVLSTFATSAEPVPADVKRDFLTHDELVESFLDSPGKPEGHGLKRSPSDPLHGGGPAGYYSFPISKRIQGISLDTISYDNGPNGHIPDPQFQWLENQLMKYSKYYYDSDTRTENPDGKNKLIMLFSHHSSASLNNPGARAEAAPYHCFTQADQPECADGEGLRDLLFRFPNVIAWVNGHEHNNAVRGFDPGEGFDKARAFWEINTAAHIDWPQQSRLIEIAYRPGRDGARDTVLIYGTTVDHSAPLKPNPRRQSRMDFLTSYSRAQSFRDACIREGQANCEAGGTPGDKNVRLVQKAPFNLGD